MNDTAIIMLILLLFNVLVQFFKPEINTSITLKIIKAYVSILAMFGLGYYICSFIQETVQANGSEFLTFSVVILQVILFVWIIIRNLKAYIIGLKNSTLSENLHISICNIIQVIIAFGILNNILFVLKPDSFSGVSSSTAFADYFHFVYYSFVTFTTLGYGDIVPKGIYAQLLVIIESSIMLCVITISVFFIKNRIKPPSSNENEPLNQNTAIPTKPKHTQHRNSNRSLPSKMNRKHK